MLGDILCDMDYRALGEHLAADTADLVVVTTDVEVPLPFSTVEMAREHLTRVAWRPTYRAEILTGIYGLRPEALESLPPEGPYGLDDLVDARLATGRPVGRLRITAHWADVGTPESYADARAWVQSLHLPFGDEAEM
jgi:NDP-sugar pyrophosphorylase family protein